MLGNISVAAGIPISYNDLGIGKEYIDGNQILSKIKKTNLISANISLNVLTIGYRSGDMYYQFTMNEKHSSKFSFSKDPIDLLLHGNGEYVGRKIEAKLALSVSQYREYGFNVAYDVGDNLWLGARAKLLFGRIGANSVNNILSLYTDPDAYALDVTSDLLINASIPGTMEIDPSDGTVTRFKPELQVKYFIFNPINIGGAIDFGVNKVFENGWKFSASLLNIGMINWNTNIHQLYHKSPIKYPNTISGTTGINGWSDFVDTIKSIANFHYTGGKTFSQWLTPEIMAGISYPVSDYVRLGVTGYAGISSVGIPWALTATALTDNTSNVFGSLSYTVTNSSFVNIGAGFGVRLGAFNLHAITDNLLALFNPASQRYGTVQFGINFKFGCGDGDSGKSSRYKSIPCPAFGHSSRNAITSVPCSGK
jgi:hypothetical protein